MSTQFADPSEPYTLITARQLTALIEQAREAPLRRARICLHTSPDELLHEMVIALCRGSYVAPHRHPGKTESFHLLAGEIDVWLFAENGQPAARHTLSAENPVLPRVMRVRQPLWHTIQVRSEWAVVYETTNGPFCKEATEVAPWAAPPDDAPAIARFREKLESWNP